MSPALRWATRALLTLLLNFVVAAPSVAFMSLETPQPAQTTKLEAAAQSQAPLLVKFKPGTSESDSDAAIKAIGGGRLRHHAQLSLAVVDPGATSRAALLAAYARHPLVEWVEPAHQVAQAGSPNDPSYAQQWALPKISWDKAYGVVPVLGSAKIAILDTGIDATHPDLVGRVSLGRSFVGGLPETDLSGHGTAMAGIAVANTNNLMGIAGVAYAGANVTSGQVLSPDGTGWDSDVVAGVLWAADSGANVILMAFSSPDFSAALQDAVNYAWGKGAVVIAATGSTASAAKTYPAGMANVIGVAATDQNDAIAPRSNTVSAAVGAPGVGIYATKPGAGYANIEGTSPAAAETAGLAALLMASGRTNSAAATQIRGATDPIAGAAFGRINVYKALTATVAPQPTPRATPTPPPGPTPAYSAAANIVTATISPTSGCAGQTTTYMMTITNSAQSDNQSRLGSVSISIPTGYSAVVVGTVVATAPRVWSSAPMAGQIRLFAVGNNDKLRAGESVTVTFVATNPTTPGPYQWTTVAYVSADWTPPAFTFSGPQPTVTITNCTGEVVVTKNTTGGNGTFSFTLTGGPAAVTASATISTTGSPAGSGTATFTGLVPGTYTVTEAANAGFVSTPPTTCTAIVTTGGSTPCTFNNVARGSVVVTKNTQGGNGSFVFTLTNGVTMTATISTTGTPLGQGTATFTGLAPGTYTVSEAANAGFVPVGPTTCTAVVTAGQANTSCTFTNVARGSVVVTKNTSGGNGSFVFTLTNGVTMTATISTTGSPLGQGTATFTGLAPGTYTVTEAANPAFAPVGPTTCTAVVTAGQANTSCVFTNVARGQVVVTKNTEGGNGTFVFTLTNGVTMTATISTTGTPLGQGTATFSGLAPGTYTVTEAANPDFVQTPPTSCIAVVTAGGSTPCTFNNVARGSVVVTKNTEGGNGSFVFTLTNGVTMTATISTTGTPLGQGTATFTGLAPGTYTVSETANPDFVPVGSTTCTAVVTAGQANTSCIFTNVARGSVVVTKNTEGGNGSFVFTLTNGVTMTATISTTGSPLGQGTATFTGLAPGTYTVSEAANPGFVPVGPTTCTAVVTAGQANTSCVFANAARGSVVVTKNTEGGNGTFVFTLTNGVTMTATISTTGTPLGQGTATFTGLAPGTYTVTEAPNSGFVPVGPTTCTAVVTAGQANTSCVFANAARGSVVVTKNTEGGNGSFVFTLTNGVTMTATISTTTTTPPLGQGTATFSGLAPGTYTVTEAPNPGFVPVGPTTCTAVVTAGQANTSCVFSNVARGQVVVTKNTEGGNGSFVFTLTNGVTMTATISTTGTPLGQGTATFSGLAPGTYTVTEAPNSGFVPVGPTTCIAVVTAGGSTPCTFANAARGSVVVTKNTEGGNGSFVFTLTNGVTMTATISTTTTTPPLGQGTATFSGLAPGTYTVSEAANPAFAPVGPTTCTAVVTAGQANTSCVFSNVALGQVVVTKNTEGGNGTFVFTLTNGVTMTATISTTTTTPPLGQGTATFSGLAPGTYTVSEAANADFAPVGPTTCTAVVTAGGSTPCTFNNIARGQVVVTKNTEGGNGTFVFTLTNGVTMTATISTTGTPLGQGTATFSGLAPGTYTVTEAANPDFVPVGLTTCTAVVTAGGSTPCTFNNAARGSVVVTKNTEGGNGTFVFTLTNGVTMTATISTTTTTPPNGQGTATFTGLAPGTYTVTETANPDFVPVGSTTCTAVVTAGQANTSCTFTNVAHGQVVVTKNTEGGNGTFVFTLTNGVTMTATISTTGSPAGQGTATFSGLAPGTYTVTEAPNPNFVPVGSTTCTALVSAGGSTPCTFTNAARGSVVVTKNTQGGNGTFTFTLTNGVTMTATISTTGSPAGQGTATFSGLAPGTYTVTESANPDFVPVGSTTCTAVVSAGGSTSCTFNNAARGSVVVTKNTQGGNGTFVFTLTNGVTMTATISTTGSPAGQGTATFSGLAPGTYTVTESANPDFAPVGSTTCTAVVTAGQANTSCVFNNVARGRVVVTKNTIGGNGSFDFTLSGGPASTTATATISTSGGTGSATFTALAPGTYTVSESVSASFTPIGSTSCSVVVPPGGTVTCTFTNAKKVFAFMTGGGQLHEDDGAEANFGGDARGTPGEPGAKGHFNYVTRTGTHLDGKVDEILAVDPATKTMWFCFTDKKSDAQYTVRWQDVAEPNRGQDRLGLWSGCELTPTPQIHATNNPVEKGNVQWHPPH